MDDPFIFDLINNFGGDGYLIFFGTLEIISREFDVNSPGFCQVSVKFLSKKLQLSKKKVQKVLEFCQKHDRIYAELTDDKITLNCPKLKDICDEYTKKQLTNKEKQELKNQERVGIKSGVSPKKIALEEEEEEEYITTSPTSKKLANKLFSLIQQNDPKAKKPNFSSWSETIDKLMRIDKRSEEEIEKVIEWCQKDSFWKSNILSADKLRKQFTRLVIKMKQSEDDEGNDDKFKGLL